MNGLAEELGLYGSLFLIHSMNVSMTGSSTRGWWGGVDREVCFLERHELLVRVKEVGVEKSESDG